MPDAQHFDIVAMRYGDPLTRWLEDAVDDADAQAQEVSMVDVQEPGVPGGGQQHGDVPPSCPRVQPEGVKPAGRTKDVHIRLMWDDYDLAVQHAAKAGVPPTAWLKATLLAALDKVRGGAC